MDKLVDESSKSPDKPIQPDLEKISKLLFLSFRFSQGDNGVQRLIFRYLHKLHPDWRISDSSKDSIYNNLLEPVTKFVLPGKERSTILHTDKKSLSSPTKLTPEMIGIVLQQEIDILQEILADTKPGEGHATIIRLEWEMKYHLQPRVDLIDKVTGRIGEKDYDNLVDHSGRVRTNPNKDRWTSHLIDYALKGKATGVPEYDQMFAEIKDNLYLTLKTNPSSHDSTLIRLYDTAKTYNAHHSPEEQINIPFPQEIIDYCESAIHKLSLPQKTIG